MKKRSNKIKNYGGTFQEPENAMGGLQLAQSGLYDSSFLKHGQIQANYPSNLDVGPDNDKPQVSPNQKKLR